jgi:hypothetical protein
VVLVSREVLLAEHDCLRRSDIMAMKAGLALKNPPKKPIQKNTKKPT